MPHLQKTTKPHELCTRKLVGEINPDKIKVALYSRCNDKTTSLVDDDWLEKRHETHFAFGADYAKQLITKLSLNHLIKCILLY